MAIKGMLWYTRETRRSQKHKNERNEETYPILKILRAPEVRESFGKIVAVEYIEYVSRFES